MSDVLLDQPEKLESLEPDPYSNQGDRLYPPYTDVSTKFWKPRARLGIIWI